MNRGLLVIEKRRQKQQTMKELGVSKPPTTMVKNIIRDVNQIQVNHSNTSSNQSSSQSDASSSSTTVSNPGESIISIHPLQPLHLLLATTLLGTS